LRHAGRFADPVAVLDGDPVTVTELAAAVWLLERPH
jgi:hypothetical protein